MKYYHSLVFSFCFFLILRYQAKHVQVHNIYRIFKRDSVSLLSLIAFRKSSVVVWLFALAFEMSKGNSEHRIHALFERSLADEKLQSSVVLWRCYVAYEIDIARNPSAARRVFFRAIHACPW